LAPHSFPPMHKKIYKLGKGKDSDGQQDRCPVARNERGHTEKRLLEQMKEMRPHDGHANPNRCGCLRK
jgi:hypothetical protein